MSQLKQKYKPVSVTLLKLEKHHCCRKCITQV